jgi:hypothetical protein
VLVLRQNYAAQCNSGFTAVLPNSGVHRYFAQM